VFLLRLSPCAQSSSNTTLYCFLLFDAVRVLQGESFWNSAPRSFLRFASRESNFPFTHFFHHHFPLSTISSCCQISLQTPSSDELSTNVPSSSLLMCHLLLLSPPLRLILLRSSLLDVVTVFVTPLIITLLL
jgi:hypothetical protein